MPEGVGAAVVDASTFADHFLLCPGERERHGRARAVIDRLSALGVTLYEPSLFEWSSGPSSRGGSGRRRPSS